MATLTISHYIYLNRDQRYKLHAGEPLEIVGVSVPVWFHKGSTSEPAQELFCKYKLTNEGVNKAIMPSDEGYHINLPQKSQPDKEAPEEVQEVVGMYLGTSERLLDIKDGGSEVLEFRQYNKVHQDKHAFNVVHFVEIKPDELLHDTLS
jgi:hypothetical protein